jgi:NodT family efflux transporter outer membrane factor (OMF) lipoprotein
MNRFLGRLGPWCALIVAAAGCRVGPDYRTPDPPAGATSPLMSLDASVETPQEPPDDWWRLYQDPLLDRLLVEAFTANTDLAAAEANLTASRAILAAARAGRYPKTDINVEGIRGRDAATDEILELTGRRPQTISLLEDVFEVAYEVDLFGRVRRSIEASRADTAAAIAARDSLKVVVAAETARAYAEVCAVGEELDVERRLLDVVSHQAEITEHGRAAGANSEFDVVRAEGLVAQIRARIPPLEGQRRAALFQLAAVLGRTPSNAPFEVNACTTPPHLAALIPVGDGAALLKRRPDVRRAERQLASATARIGVATADLYPKVSLIGLYGAVGLQLSDLAAERGLTWGVGPSISWNFPNQSLPRARVRQAQAGADAALASFRSVILTALKETEQSLATYGAALDRRQALADAQDKAHREFTMAKDQVLAGSLSSLDLLTTEQSLIAVDEAVAATDATLVQDQIALFKALGGGWRASAVSYAP